MNGSPWATWTPVLCWTADTAQTLHVIHTGFTNGGATLAQRLVFMQVATELLAARIGR